MVGPSVFPEKQVISEWLVLQYFQKKQVISEWLDFQYFQIHELYQNDWSFSISRYTSYTKMVGPSVFPDTQVIPKWLVLQYFQIHRSSECLVLQYFQIHGSKNNVLKPKIDFSRLISSLKGFLIIF